MGRGDVVAGTTAWVAWLGLNQEQLVRLGSRIVALGRNARRAALLMSFGLLDLTRARLAIERNEEIVGLVGCWNVGYAGLLLIQDLKHVVSELRFAAKDEELIAAYNQVIHFKRIVDRLEPQVLELQGVLKINESLKKEVDELQSIHASIGEVVGEVSAQAGAAEGEAIIPLLRASRLLKVVSRLADVKLIDYVACRQWIKLHICVLACLTFHKNVRLYKSSAVLLLEGQSVCSLPESVGYLSALGSSFRVPGQPYEGRTA
ncbi:hypothetical protein ACFXTH_014643 [Malus domestica]